MVGPSCWEGTLVLDLGNSWSETWYYHLLYYVINLRFYILYNILDIYAFTFSGVGVFAIQGRPTWFPLPPWRPDWWQRGIDGPGGERKRRKKCEIDYCYNCLQKYLTNQLLALQWVHNHIADFGGDPDRVTIQVNKIGYCCIVTSALLFSSITWWDGNII